MDAEIEPVRMGQLPRPPARSFRAAGVPCQLDRVSGMYHGADVRLAETSALMRAFQQRMLDALGAAIGAPSHSSVHPR